MHQVATTQSLIRQVGEPLWRTRSMGWHEPSSSGTRFARFHARQQRTATDRRTTTQQSLYQSFVL